MTPQKNRVRPVFPNVVRNPDSRLNIMTETATGNDRGFTLLEILVAMAILGVVLSLIYASFTKTIAQITESEAEADIYQMARISMERIREDLQCALPPNSAEPSPENRNTPGMVEFLGKNEELDGREADTLLFVSSKHLSVDESDSYEGPARIAFYVVKNDREQGLTLYRADTPELETPPEEKTGGLVLCNQLFSVNLTYFDSEGTAHEEWNSADETYRGKLPVMVVIELAFVNPSQPDTPLRFETGVTLPMSRADSGSEP